MSKSPGTVITFTPDLHAHLIPYLAAIHASCITQDHTIATFLPPLSHEKLLGWWKDRIAEVSAGSRIILMLSRDATSNYHNHNDNDIIGGGGSGGGDYLEQSMEGSEIVGVVMLSMPYSETGPFRASIEKLLVHASWRGRGGARKLVEAIEEEALSRGRTMLVSSTPFSSVIKMQPEHHCDAPLPPYPPRSRGVIPLWWCLAGM